MKTPEQEAKDLVEKFADVEMPKTCDMAYIGKEAAKQCALVCVEHTLQALGKADTDYDLLPAIEHQNNIKTAIEEL